MSVPHKQGQHLRSTWLEDQLQDLEEEALHQICGEGSVDALPQWQMHSKRLLPLKLRLLAGLSVPFSLLQVPS